MGFVIRGLRIVPAGAQRKGPGRSEPVCFSGQVAVCHLAGRMAVFLLFTAPMILEQQDGITLL
jgi:hypothetical protein